VPWERPSREPDVRRRFSTGPSQALLYRLTGDGHPLHSDPVFARAAGFDGPIMHGLCTFGFTARGLLGEMCGGDVSRFGSMRCRFSRPVYPGTPLDVAIWRTADGAVFQTSAGGEVAIDHGTFTVSV
jgi:acyl dehydratase